MHPSHTATLVDFFSENVAAKFPNIHRHWSAEILSVHGLLDIPSLQQPALPLAMLPSPAFENLIAHLGGVLGGARIRRIISHAEIHMLQEAIGSSVVDFVRSKASQLHPGLADHQWCFEGPLANAIVEMGEELLAKAFLAAPRAVGLRGLWRLPVRAVSATNLMSFEGGEALHLSTRVLQEIEPAWLSLFTADR